MSYTNTFFNSALHLLYPKICAGCGSDLIRDDELICLECVSGLPLTNFSEHSNNPVEKVFFGRLHLESATSYLYYTKASLMQNLLHELKYRGNAEVGKYFGRRMGETFMQSGRFNKIDALVPLPLFYAKEKVRGYNQAAVICDGLSEIMNLPILADVVIKKKKTETQTQMNRTERWSNIEGKFELKNRNEILGKHLLLVDDVITTGATLEACGMELLKGDGVKLSIASLAYTSL